MNFNSISLPHSKKSHSEKRVCVCLLVCPSLNVEPKPIDRSHSNSISGVLLKISPVGVFVFDLPLKLRVVHIKKLKFQFSQK